MTRMVRKQIYISEDQERLLKTRAAELNVPESALIRRGIDRSLESGQRPALDEHAWQDALAFLRERARIDLTKAARGWTREELHERTAEKLPD